MLLVAGRILSALLVVKSILRNESFSVTSGQCGPFTVHSGQALGWGANESGQLFIKATDSFENQWSPVPINIDSTDAESNVFFFFFFFFFLRPR